MESNSAIERGAPVAARGGPWGHLLVSASACVLTVSIVGSVVFLTQRIYSRYSTQGRIREFLVSLENRTAKELQEKRAELEARPKLVEQMLPELARTLRSPRSDEQLCAAIEISNPFLKHKRIRDAVFELRTDGREGVAATAVGALATIEPADQAAAILDRCMEDAPSGAIGPAGLDRLCAGLFALAGPGLDVMKKHVGKLSVDRRVWLAGLVNQLGGPYRLAWLEMLAADGDIRVKAAAELAMRPAVEEKKATAEGRG